MTTDIGLHTADVRIGPAGSGGHILTGGGLTRSL